jgi:hypothetical protein
MVVVGWPLADRSCKLSPAGWARQAVDAYHEFKADLSMAETNCAKWRRESVPVGLREKGFEARCYFCFFSTDLDFGGRISFVWCFWILAMPVS